VAADDHQARGDRHDPQDEEAEEQRQPLRGLGRGRGRQRAGAPGLAQFVAQCLQRLPEERPSPRALLQHPFVAMHDDGNTEPVGAWVRAKLDEMRFRSVKRH